MDAYPVLKKSMKKLGEMSNVIQIYNPMLGEYYLYQAVSRIGMFPYLILETDSEYHCAEVLVRVLLKLGIFKNVEKEEIAGPRGRSLSRFVLVKHELVG